MPIGRLLCKEKVMSSGKKPSKVKQSHYLPRQAYLSQFSTEDKIWVYNLADGKDGFIKNEPFQTKPKKFGRENYLYEAPGLPENLLEQVLQPIESSYQHLFEKKIAQRKKLTRAELEVVSLFIATLEQRVPAQREHWHNQLEELKARGMDVARANNSEEAAQRFAEQIDQAKLGAFAQGLIAAMQVNRWRFADYCFLYIEREDNEDQFFITSDHPTSLIDYTFMNGVYGIPPTGRTLEFTVPLSRNLALFINNVGISGYKPVRHNFVREINNRTVNRSDRYLVAPQKLSDRFCRGVYQRYPQSLILEYAKLPQGNVDKELKKADKRKLEGQD
jgi:hypothetical protein